MSEHEYMVGDLAFVIRSGRPTQLVTVTNVERRKRGLKVTTGRYSQWDISGKCPWGRRKERQIGGQAFLMPYSEALNDELKCNALRDHVSWVYGNFYHLPIEDQQALGEHAKRVHEAMEGRFGGVGVSLASEEVVVDMAAELKEI